MKKALLGIVVIGAVFVLSGCGKPAAVDQNTAQKQTQGNEAKKDGSIISSIKDALNSGKKMECTYTTKIGDKEVKATMQTDGKNFKSSSEIDGRKMYSVMKDEVAYTWGDGIPMASKLEMSCMKDLPQAASGDGSAPSTQDPEKSFDDATNVVCNPIASVDVSVPSDVKFQDMCEMMKGIQNMQVPAGVNMPNIPSMP